MQPMEPFMPEPITLALGGAALAIPAALGVTVRRAARARTAARAAIFDECRALLDGPVVTLAPDGFARLSGTRGGHRFDLRVLPDMLSYRKLPALWLMVTLIAPQPVRGRCDILLRPTGGEPFSPFGLLPFQCPPPPGCPEDAALRCDDPSDLPEPGALAPHLAILGDPAAKEQLIAPQALRLVWLAEEADRGRYLIYRDAEMGLSPMAGTTVRRLMDALLALHADLAETAESRLPERRTA